MSKFSIMKPIDKAIIENVEKITATNEYQKMLDTYNSWDDKIQSAFKGGLIFLVVFIPLVLILIFVSINSAAKERLKIVEDIIATGNSIISSSAEVRSISNRYFGRPISSKSAFERELVNSLPSEGIDSAKILIGDFTVDEIDGVNELRAELKFSELSSENLFGLFNILALRQKMKMEEISIKKNSETNLLEGTVSVLHFSPIVEETYE